MDNPADAVRDLLSRLEAVGAEQEMLRKEEQAIRQKLDEIRAVLMPVKPQRLKGVTGARGFTQDGFVPSAQPDRILGVIRAAGREGVTAYELRKAAQVSKVSLPSQLTRLRLRDLIRRREGTHLWVAVTPPDGGYATPADEPVS